MDSENEYEAGHVMSYHTNHSGSDNKDPGNNAQFYLGRRCSHAPHMRDFFAYFDSEHVAAFKNPYFLRRFTERALSHFMNRFISRDSACSCFYP